jgi:hypothetical protein
VVVGVTVSECRCSHQPALSTVELLRTVAAGLEAALDRDPWRTVEVVARRAPGAPRRADVAALAIRRGSW